MNGQFREQALLTKLEHIITLFQEHEEMSVTNNGRCDDVSLESVLEQVVDVKSNLFEVVVLGRPLEQRMTGERAQLMKSLYFKLKDVEKAIITHGKRSCVMKDQCPGWQVSTSQLMHDCVQAVVQFK